MHFKVETYSNAQGFLDKYDANKQGCIILDVRLPGMSGLELLEHIHARKIRIPLIMMTGYADVPMAIRAMKLGAADFIVKPFNHQSLLETVQKCNEKSVGQEDLEYIAKRIHSLTEQERQILNLIVEGKLNKEISYELKISISTVEAHRSNMVRKMQAKNFAQLITMYLKYQFEAMLTIYPLRPRPVEFLKMNCQDTLIVIFLACLALFDQSQSVEARPRQQGRVV